MKRKTRIGLCVLCVLSLAGAFGLAACGETPSKKESATLSVTGLTAVYDGTSKTVSVAVSPAEAGTATVEYFSADDEKVESCIDAGTYNVRVTLSSETHEANAVESTLTITPKALTIDGISPVNKWADGETTVDYTGTATLEGIVSGDEVSLTGFSLETLDAEYGIGKEVKVSATLTGADAHNYTYVADSLLVDVYPEADGWRYLPVLDGGDVTGWNIAGYTGSETALILPASFADLPVVGLTEDCFVNNKTLAKVQIPAGCAFTASAFDGCENLVSIILDSLCFEFRPYLDDDDDPAIDSFDAIGYGGEGAGGEVAIPSHIDGIPVTGLGPHLFAGDVNGVTKLVIPSTITFIGLALAQNNPTLKTVVFEDRTQDIEWGVDQFGAWTFAGSAVESIDLGNGIRTIPSIFAKGAALKEITIPASVTNMGTEVFVECLNLTTAVFEDREQDITFARGNLDGSWMFFGCSKLNKLVIGDGITALPKIFAPTSAVDVSLGKDVTFLDVEALPFAGTVTTLTIEGAGLLATITGADAWGSLFANVTTFRIAEGLTATDYITQNFTNVKTEEGYTIYSKVL